jgi:putative transposase
MIDLYSRQVVGCAMSDRNDTKLVADALIMAVWRRGKLKDVIVHSDQGATYASGNYRGLLKENGLLCSMSRKSECYDNAVAESFCGTLKSAAP